MAGFHNDLRSAYHVLVSITCDGTRVAALWCHIICHVGGHVELRCDMPHVGLRAQGFFREGIEAQEGVLNKHRDCMCGRIRQKRTLLLAYLLKSSKARDHEFPYLGMMVMCWLSLHDIIEPGD